MAILFHKQDQKHFKYAIGAKGASINGLQSPVYLNTKESSSISKTIEFVFITTYLLAIAYFEPVALKLFFSLLTIFSISFSFVGNRIKTILFGVTVLATLYLATTEYSITLSSYARYTGYILPVLLSWRIIKSIIRKTIGQHSNNVSNQKNIDVLKDINTHINHILFNKSELYRNNPKWDLITFKLIFPSAFLFYFMSIAFHTHFESISLSKDSSELFVMTAVISNYIASFVHLNSTKSSKYKHAFDTYNKIIECRSTKSADERLKMEFEIWESSLALDILHFDMWAHKSFREFFAFQLTKAISELKTEESKIILSSATHKHEFIIEILKKDLEAEINSGKLSVKEAGAILDYYFQKRFYNHFHTNDATKLRSA